MKLIKYTSLIVLVLTILSRIFGFIREISVANLFGVNSYTDVFFTALIFPIMLSQIIGSNLSVKMIGELKASGEHEKTNIINKYFYNSIIIFLLISVCIVLFNLITIKVAESSGEFNTFLKSCNILLSIATIFWGISYVQMGMLNAEHRFFASSIAPLVSNVLNIFILLIFRDYISSIPIAFLLSAIVQMLFLSWYVKGYVKWEKNLIIKLIDLKIAKYLFIMILSSLFLQLPIILERYIVIGLGEGYVTILNLAQKVYQLPTNIIISSIITIIFPSVLKYIYHQNASNMLYRIIADIFIICSPIVSGIYLFSGYFINILFSDTLNNQQLNDLKGLIQIFGLSTTLYIIRDLLLKLLFSLNYSVYAMKISIITAILNIALDVILIYSFGILAIPIALIVNLAVFGVLAMKVINKDILKKINGLNVFKTPLFIFNLICIPIIVITYNYGYLAFCYGAFLISMFFSIKVFINFSSKKIAL